MPPSPPRCSGMSALRDDYRFIAHAREDIPYLLSEVERLRAELDAAKWDLTYTDNCDACVHNVKGAECGLDCEDCTLDCTCRACFNGETAWQWRGLCAENGGRNEY